LKIEPCFAFAITTLQTACLAVIDRAMEVLISWYSENPGRKRARGDSNRKSAILRMRGLLGSPV